MIAGAPCIRAASARALPVAVDIDPLTGLRHDVAVRLGAPSSSAGDNLSFCDAELSLQRLHASHQFHPVAAHLHLVVPPPRIQAAVISIFLVSGAVEPLGRREEFATEALCSLRSAGLKQPRHAGAQVQFADHPNGLQG